MSIVPLNLSGIPLGAAVIDPHGARDLAADVLDADGVMRPMPASYYANTTVTERALFGQRQGIYGFLTEELIDWLQARIAGRSAIEIGAGHGALAAALGIKATDNKMQEDPKIAAYYAAMGQPPVKYGKNVERLAAKDAVKKYRPRVVIASWVTHLYRPSRHDAGGNMFGVNEEQIISQCEEYIFIGNGSVHAGKSIWTLEHELSTPHWLYSRAHNGSPDFIATWRRA